MADTRDLLSQLTLDPQARASAGTSPGTAVGRRWAMILALTVLALLGVLFVVANPLKGRDATPEVRVATARGVAAGSDSSSSVLDASGYVIARRQATVSSKVTGKVVEIAIEEGQRVEANALLARIDDSNVRTQLALAEAQAEAARSVAAEADVQLAEAERSLVRQQALAARQLVSEATLDAARAQRDALRVRLASQREQVTVAERQVAVQTQQLDDTVIRAPFAGIITVKNAQPGEMISPLSAGGDGTRTGIGTLVDMESLEVDVDVSENFINRVQPGQPVTIRLNAYPESPMEGRVIAVIPTADRAKATVKVRIAFTAPDPRVLPEMGVRVSFLTANRDPSGDAAGAGESRRTAVVIPAAAEREGVVWVLKGDRVERRAVGELRLQGDALSVGAGLVTGERVVLDPPPSLRDGATVRVAQDS